MLDQTIDLFFEFAKICFFVSWFRQQEIQIFGTRRVGLSFSYLEVMLTLTSVSDGLCVKDFVFWKRSIKVFFDVCSIWSKCHRNRCEDSYKAFLFLSFSIVILMSRNAAQFEHTKLLIKISFSLWHFHNGIGLITCLPTKLEIRLSKINLLLMSIPSNFTLASELIFSSIMFNGYESSI